MAVEAGVDERIICVTSTKENWRTTLSRLGIGGKHYFCNQEQSKDIRKGLEVEAIPFYILINKQGYIVESDCLDLERSIDKIDKLLK